MEFTPPEGATSLRKIVTGSKSGGRRGRNPFLVGENFTESTTADASVPAKKAKKLQPSDTNDEDDDAIIKETETGQFRESNNNRSIALSSSSSSEDDKEDDETGEEDSLYCKIPPPTSPFHERNVGPYREDWIQAVPHLNVFSDAKKLREAHLKMSKRPTADKQHFCQFSYKKPPTLFLLTNAYGLTVNDAQDYQHRTILRHIDELEPKHRVQILLPTVSHWWHEPSRKLMEDCVERFVQDVKTIAQKTTFSEACKRFGLENKLREVFQNLRNKLLTAKAAKSFTRTKQAPGVFGVRVYNSLEMPSRIPAPVFVHDKEKKSIRNCKWQNLLQPSYLHAMLLLQIRGFKITKSGVSLDMSLESFAYSPIDFVRVERGLDAATAMKRRCKLFDTADSSSSSCDEDDSEKQTTSRSSYGGRSGVRGSVLGLGTDDW